MSHGILFASSVGALAAWTCTCRWRSYALVAASVKAATYVRKASYLLLLSYVTAGLAIR